MSIPIELDKLLVESDSLNEKYNAIQTPSGVDSLVFHFWSVLDVTEGLALREDWDVESTLIPFYGNWHELF